MMKKVFVSGCFDMLHSGHVAFFESAAKLGELYVGIGSDSTINELKGRYPINSEQERLYMVKSIKYVKDAFINKGNGVLDFSEQVKNLKPDIIYVNNDNDTSKKEQFCKENGIELIIGSRDVIEGLDEHSTTDIVKKCKIPYRIDLAGGWLDQQFVNEIYSGCVLTISVEPDIRFRERSGLSSSTRRKAIDLWGYEIPQGNKEKLAKQLFCYDNEPIANKKYLSGSQDSLGIVLPGLNKLEYSNSYWPYHIEQIYDEEILSWLERHIWLIPLNPREQTLNIYDAYDLKLKHVRNLSIAAEETWTSILKMDLDAFGKSVLDSFKAQIKIFPRMVDDHIWNVIEEYVPYVKGYKLTGCGGGGYVMVVSDTPVKNGFQVKIVRN
jgi:cytidyltransferase-like protein